MMLLVLCQAIGFVLNYGTSTCIQQKMENWVIVMYSSWVLCNSLNTLSYTSTKSYNIISKIQNFSHLAGSHQKHWGRGVLEDSIWFAACCFFWFECTVVLKFQYSCNEKFKYLVKSADDAPYLMLKSPWA